MSQSRVLLQCSGFCSPVPCGWAEGLLVSSLLWDYLFCCLSFPVLWITSPCGCTFCLRVCAAGLTHHHRWFLDSLPALTNLQQAPHRCVGVMCSYGIGPSARLMSPPVCSLTVPLCNFNCLLFVCVQRTPGTHLGGIPSSSLSSKSGSNGQVPLILVRVQFHQCG